MLLFFSFPDISGSLPLLPLPQAESTLLEDEPVQRDDEAMDTDEDAVPEPSHIETSAASVSEPMDDEPSFQPEDSLEESLPAPALHEGRGYTRIRQEASGPALSTRRGDPRRIHWTDRAAATLPRTSIACWLCQKQLDRHHPLPSQQMVGLQLRSSHQQWPGGLSPQAELRCRKTQPAVLPPDRLIEERMPGRLHHNAPHLQPQDEEDTAEAISFVARQSHQSMEITWKGTAHWQAATSVLCSSHSLLIDAACSVQWIFCDTNI